MKIDRWKLDLENIGQSDAGNYTCDVKNPYGHYNFTFNIRVHCKLFNNNKMILKLYHLVN